MSETTYRKGYCVAAVDAGGGRSEQCPFRDRHGGVCGHHRRVILRRGGLWIVKGAPVPQLIQESRTALRLLSQVA